MSPREAKRLVGRTIVAVELNGSWKGERRLRSYMHAPVITLDDGTFLRFTVEEHPEGGEYGVNIVRELPDK